MASTHILGRIQFEQTVAGVLRMITEHSYFKELHHFINPKLFYSNDSSENAETLRFVLRMMLDLLKEDKTEKFSIQYIDSMIPQRELNGEKGKKYLDIYNGWIGDDRIREKMNDDGCFDAFIDYIKALQIHEIAESFGKRLQKNEVPGAIALMNEALYKISKIGNHDVETLGEGEILQIIKDDNDDKYARRTLLIGNPLIDELTGGFEQQTLNGFIAPSGGGKSAMAHHLIGRAIDQEMKVWVGVLEDRKKSFIYKLMAKMSGVPMRRLKKEFKQLTSEEMSRVTEADKKINKYLKVEFLYGCDIDTVHKAALDYDNECRLRNMEIPIVNIVDYTGHISGRSFGDKMYEKMRIAYGARKDFSLKHDKICFDFAQINREGSKNAKATSVITQNDLAGSYDIVQIFDNLFSINRSSDDISNSTCRLHICKARDSANHVTVQVGTEFEKCRYNMLDWELIDGDSSVTKLSQKITEGE